MSRSIKILHIIEFVDKGGAERQMRLLAKHSDFEHYILHLDIRYEGVEFIDGFSGFDTLSPSGFYSVYNRVSKYIKNNSIDVVQLWLPEKITLPALLAAKRNHCSVISCDRRAPLYWGKMAIRDRVKYIQHVFSDYVVSNYRARLIKHPILSFIFWFKSYRMIPNGFEFNSRDSIGENISGRPNLLFVGRMVKQKRLDVLIDAYSDIDVSSRFNHLHVVGGGPLLEDYRSMVKKRGIENIVFHGELPRWQEKFSYRNSYLVIPSEKEGMPNVLFEAIALGMPVLVSNIDEITQWFDSVFPEYFSVNSNSDLRSKLIYMASLDSEFLRSHSDDLKNYIYKFSLNSMAKSYDSLYKELVGC
jgi:glycosyltransferase involved in cell wall biosynthesis